VRFGVLRFWCFGLGEAVVAIAFSIHVDICTYSGAILSVVLTFVNTCGWEDEGI
jgi:hypothetical protein